MEPCSDRVRAAHRSPLAALVAAATDMTRYLDMPEEVADSLAFLQMDLSDPDVHRLMVINSRRMLEGSGRGTAVAWVRADVDAVLDPYRSRTRSAKRGPGRSMGKPVRHSRG